MKNAKSKMTAAAAALRGWKPVEHDAMPLQVATDLLCSLENMTMPMRKTFLDARATLWCAIEEKKPREFKLARKYHEAALLQLGKWNHRAQKKRRTLQNRYARALGMPEESTGQQLSKNRIMAALDLAVALIDQVTDGTAAEITERGLRMGRTGDFGE
jgi:hypothetical protein